MGSRCLRAANIYLACILWVWSCVLVNLYLSKSCFTCSATVQEPRRPLALSAFPTGLTRQRHAPKAGGRESELAGLRDLFLSNQRSSWAELRVSGANRRHRCELTGFVSACLPHVSWNELLCAARPRAETFLLPEKQTAPSRFQS